MKSLAGVLLGFVFLIVPFESSRAKEDSEWQKLNAEAEKNFFAGKYADSIEKAKQAFAVADKTYGTQSREAATSMSMLGHLMLTLGQLDKAEVLYRQSMEIREKVLGKNDKDYGESLGNLAGLYRSQGRYLEAESLNLQALVIQEKTLGTEHDDFLANTSNMGLTYSYLGKYDKAIPYFERVIAAHEKKDGLKNPKLALPLNNLAEVYRKQGKFTQAEATYQRAIRILEMAYGGDHPNVAMFNNNLALLYYDKGDYSQARRLYQKSLDLFEKTLGDKHPIVATTMVNLANIHFKLGQYEQAEKIYSKAKLIREATYGPEHPEVAASLNNLGLLYSEQSRHAEAEAMFLKALPIFEKVYGPNHPDVAKSLSNLALVYSYQGRFDQAFPVMKRSLAIREKAYGPEHFEVANSLNNLGEAYLRMNNFAEGEPLLKRALAIWEKSLGADNVEVAAAAGNLGFSYNNQGRLVEAESMYLRAIAIAEKTQGTQHPRVASLLGDLGTVYQKQNNFAKAESFYQRSISIWQTVLGREHYQTTQSLNNLANLYMEQGRDSEALVTSRLVTGILRRRFVTDEIGESAGKLAEQKSNSSTFIQQLEIMVPVIAKAEDKQALASEALEIAQLARASSVSQSVAQMAARFGQRGDALAELVRAQQDTRDALIRMNRNLLEALSKTFSDRNAEMETKLRQEILTLNTRLDAQNASIASRFPKYQSLISQEPVSAAEIQKQLAAEEAMVVYTVANIRTYAWVVTRNGISFHALPTAGEEIEKQVQFLRGKLLPNAAGKLAEMSPATSARLSQSIFAPLESSLAGIKNILLVSDGALQGLPFGVLSTTQSGTPEWLAKRYSFSILPSVSALRALRAFSQSETGKLPFAGFGDPVLTGDAGGTRNLSMANVFKTRSLDTGGNALTSNGLADVEMLRKAPPLPETGDELRAISSVLKGSADALFLRQQATETLVKQSNLSDYRFLAFATHGVMAGELSGVMEPGLVLTPPTSGSTQDDGYLSASEVAQLKLNADWVLLSACNTAAPDGTPGAEGLSGLAKAFFYAGSRSLLVSNWPVASQATQMLVTDTVSTYAKTPQIGKAEAVKQAMGRMMDKPEFAHPFYWGAFVVVGE